MTSVSSRERLIEVKNLKKYYNEGKNDEVRAVDSVTFNIYKGETFGLVGESGSGKSTTGRTLIKLEDITDGSVLYKGKDITEIKGGKELLDFRKSMQMIFQDPYASLNPRLTVKDTLAGAIDVHKLASSKGERNKLVNELLDAVGLNASFANRYPGEFSGGQAQRVGIARALAVKPEFIIADEAISALDVSIQAQVTNLLIDLKNQLNLTYLFIAHDLAMVRFISDRIGVMNDGKLLEVAPANELYQVPLHPYTESLLSAIPVADPELERSRTRKGYDRTHHYYQDDSNVYLHEIGPGHFVYCDDSEAQAYKDKYKKILTS